MVPNRHRSESCRPQPQGVAKACPPLLPRRDLVEARRVSVNKSKDIRGYRSILSLVGKRTSCFLSGFCRTERWVVAWTVFLAKSSEIFQRLARVDASTALPRLDPTVPLVCQADTCTLLKSAVARLSSVVKSASGVDAVEVRVTESIV